MSSIPAPGLAADLRCARGGRRRRVDGGLLLRRKSMPGQRESRELLRPPIQMAHPSSTLLLVELSEYGFCIVLRQRIEAYSPRRSIWEMSRFADGGLDGNRPSLRLLQVGKRSALRFTSFGSYLHALGDLLRAR